MQIKNGYLVHITTWDNDEDNYSTQKLEGLSVTDVRFFLEFLSNFKILGNEYVKKSLLINLLSNCLKTYYSPYVENFKKEYEDENDFIIDFIWKVLGYSDSYENSFVEGTIFCKVFDNMEIFYIEKEINIPNVTTQFIKSEK